MKLKLIILTFIIICAIISAFIFSKTYFPLKKTIIILNGPSSSGKSSISQILEKKLENLGYLKIGIDEFSLLLLPPRLINYDPTKNQVSDSKGLIFINKSDEKGPKLEAQTGSYALRVFSAFLPIVATLARLGNNVIVDAGLSINIQWLKGSVKDLDCFRVYFIKLSAPLYILEQREKDRNGLIGLARGQYEEMERVEKTYNIPFDLTFDTAIETSEEIAEKIINLINRNKRPQAFKILKNILK